MSKHVSVMIGVGGLLVCLFYVRLSGGIHSEVEYFIVRILLALSGAYAAAGLLGSFEIQNNLIKASGGLAVMAFLYLTNPAGRVALDAAPPEKQEAIGAVDSLISATHVATPAPGGPAPTPPRAVADSISRTLGYRNYEQARVLSRPEEALVLQHRTAAVLKGAP